MIAGIDIGTSYSSICILNKDGKAEPVKISTGLAMYGNDVSLPSAVFVDNETVLVGQAAYNSRMKASENFKSEFKRDFGQEVPYHLGCTQIMPEDLYKELFVHMKTCAEGYAGTPIQFAYITHPARFSEKQKNLLKLSASRAGLLNTALLEEPVAAAYHYVLENNLDDNKTLLVYDFGGGTFDVALVKFLHGEFSLMADPSGIDRCGGIDVDMLIYNHILKSVPAELYESVKVNPKMLQNFKALLTEQSIKAKHHLSSADNFHTEFPLGFDFVSYELNRTDLNKMIAPLVDETMNCVQHLIASAGIIASDIDVVLLVGGSSRIPLVKEELERLIKKPVKENVNPELAIALGAVAMGKQNGLSCAFTAFKDANKRFGFLDSSMNQVLPAIYEEAQNFSENRAGVKMNGKWGIIDQTGRIITPFEYDELFPFKKGLAKGRIEDKWGFLNRSGTVIIPFKYPFLGEFVDGLCQASQGNLFGYLAADGYERIPLIYTKVDNFSNGRARVTRGSKVGYIDTNGNEYIPCFFDEIGDFKDGLALIKIDNRYGFIDEYGKAKTRFIYHSATEFKDGYSAVTVDGKFGSIDVYDNFTYEYYVVFVESIGKINRFTIINAILERKIFSKYSTSLIKIRKLDENSIRVKYYTKEEWAQLWESIDKMYKPDFKNEYDKLNCKQHESEWIGHHDQYDVYIREEYLIEILNGLISSNSPSNFFVKEIEVCIKNIDIPKGIIIVYTSGLDDPVKYRSDIAKIYIKRANLVMVCVDAQILTGRELKSINQVFAITRYDTGKVFIVATEIDQPCDSVMEKKEINNELIMYLGNENCYGDPVLAQKNLLFVSAYLYSILIKNSEELSEYENYKIEIYLRIFGLREKNKKNLIELKKKTNILCLKEQIINKYKILDNE